jgi:pimeloyl-ACP methyl ester carboxylesterase
MSQYTHATASTQYVEVDGTRYAYRRFGAEVGTPLVFLQHFRGTIDYWDPAVTDGLAAGRPVILINYGGVGSSTGEHPNTIEGMADQMAGAVRALGLTTIDLHGFSIGGMVAQEIVKRNPDLIRRLVLVGTQPKGGTRDGAHPDYLIVATRNNPPTFEDFLFLFFAPTPTSQEAGQQFWGRRQTRVERDPESSLEVMRAQGIAARAWHAEGEDRFADLAEITQPTLVVHGREDIMIPTINSYYLAQHLPNAQLSIYPDSGHGTLFQFPELFVSQVARFLDNGIAIS